MPENNTAGELSALNYRPIVTQLTIDVVTAVCHGLKLNLAVTVVCDAFIRLPCVFVCLS